MRKSFFLFILIVVVIAAGLAYRFRDRSGEKPAFRLAQVETGLITSIVSASGTLNAVITVKVGSQVSGQVKQLLADFNSEVREGEVIARIDPDNFEARVRQAEAELDVASANVAIKRASVHRAHADLQNAHAALAATKAQTDKARIALADARRDLDRKKTLHARTIISESEIDKATALHDQALAQLNATEADERAQTSMVKTREAILSMAEGEVALSLAQVKHREAALNQSKIDLAHTIIRSPVDGVVIDRSVDMGQTVAASLQAPTLFTIAQDLRKMQVETDMDEADIGRIQANQRVTFTVDAFPGQEFEGRVEQIRKAPRTVQNVVTYTVVVSSENPHLRLLPGMTANVRIVVDEHSNVLRVPNAALRFRPPGKETGESGGPGRPTSITPPGTGKGTGADRVKRLTEALGLDADQQARVRAIFTEARGKIGAMRRQGASLDDIRSEVERVRLRGREALLDILTPEQREKFTRLDAARASNPLTPGRVWVLGAGSNPSPIDIVAGISDGNFTEIVRGDLQAGQEVIVGTIQPTRRSPSGAKKFGF
jgi:HlyD family secretion protein